MTNDDKKRIEEHINTYRTYPDEYKGVRDPNILATMNNSYRYNPKDNTIIRKEGRINSNGDFEIIGLFKFSVENPEIKTLATNIDRDMKFITTKYNETMRELNHETGVIAPGINENWNLRDMVSEVEYLRSLYYTKGHDRNKLKAEDPVVFNRHTSRLRHFLRKYKDHIDDMVVTTKHNSKYD